MPKPTSSRPISPGTYLRTRREAAGLSLHEVALALMALPEARLASTPFAIGYQTARLEQHLAKAEADRDNLTLPHAMLLAKVFGLDPHVYHALLLVHYDQVGTGLPVPRLCRVCACSWNDPCHIPVHTRPPAANPGGFPRGRLFEPCAWAGADICSACADSDRPAVATIEPDTTRPLEGTPA